MEEKKTNPYKNRTTWKYITVKNDVLYLKDELSFGTLYAKCKLLDLKRNPKKILTASSFNFKEPDKVSFVCIRDSSSGQKKTTVETCEISDFETRFSYTDYSAVFALSERNGNKYMKPVQLCYNAAKILDIKNENSEGKELTEKEKALIPKAYALRFLMNTLKGGKKGLTEEYISTLRPCLEEYFEKDFVDEMIKLGDVKDKKKFKVIKKRLTAFFDSPEGHRYISSLMKELSDCGRNFINPVGKTARRLIEKKLSDLGYEGTYPYFKKLKDETARFIAFAEYSEFEESNPRHKALMRCAAVRVIDGKIGGVDVDESRLYDVAFVSEGKIISFETLIYDDPDEAFINEILETADDLFDGKKIPKEYIKKHPLLSKAYRYTGAPYGWIWFFCAFTLGIFTSFIVTGLTVGIATGSAAVAGLIMNDPGYVRWFVWKHGSWLWLSIPTTVIAGPILAQILLRALKQPLKIRQTLNKNNPKIRGQKNER